MPQIEIRPAGLADWPALFKLEHHYQTNYVWQMERVADDGQVTINFREIRLPRAIKVDYPHTSRNLAEEWDRQPGIILKAIMGSETAGYVRMVEQYLPKTACVTDLAVRADLRRQGIGSGLVLAAHEWALERQLRRVILETQSKNYPAIHLALKLGFEFSGYQDQHYSNQDIALFFTRFLR